MFIYISYIQSTYDLKSYHNKGFKLMKVHLSLLLWYETEIRTPVNDRHPDFFLIV